MSRQAYVRCHQCGDGYFDGDGVFKKPFCSDDCAEKYEARENDGSGGWPPGLVTVGGEWGKRGPGTLGIG